MGIVGRVYVVVRILLTTRLGSIGVAFCTKFGALDIAGEPVEIDGRLVSGGSRGAEVLEGLIIVDDSLLLETQVDVVLGVWSLGVVVAVNLGIIAGVASWIISMSVNAHSVLMSARLTGGIARYLEARWFVVVETEAPDPVWLVGLLPNGQTREFVSVVRLRSAVVVGIGCNLDPVVLCFLLINDVSMGRKMSVKKECRKEKRFQIRWRIDGMAAAFGVGIDLGIGRSRMALAGRMADKNAVCCSSLSANGGQVYKDCVQSSTTMGVDETVM